MKGRVILPHPNLNNIDVFLIFVITTTSFITRLWNLQTPNAVVFDEVHFGNFTNWYSLSEYFFDIHPPLGKLVMFLFANLSEYKGDIDFEGRYGRSYENDDYITLRLTPAIFSSLCAPLIYLTVRFSSFSHTAAFVSAFFIIFDTSLLTEQRLILSDGMLHFFSCLFLSCWAYLNCVVPYSNKWTFWMIVTGLTLGCACSCKNTSWGLMVLIAATQIIQICSYQKAVNAESISDLLYRGSLLLACVLFVYFLSFAIHFLILPFDGQGVPYMPEQMQNQFISKEKHSSELWAKRLTFPYLFFRIVTLAISMHLGNMGITQYHPYQSRPIGWPLLTDIWVAFWGDGDTEVNCCGNVFVYYIAFFSLFFVVFAFKKNQYKWGVPFVIGWCVSYFPFFLIPRSMYLYHYLIPLILGCCSVGAALDFWLPTKWRGFIAVILCGLVLIGFYFWSPYAYGSHHLSEELIIWNSNWQYGDKYHRKLQEEQNRNDQEMN